MSAAQQHQEASRWRAFFTGVRDVGMSGLALWGVWHQEHTGRVNAWLLLTYVVILGLIPASHAWALVRAPSSSPDGRQEGPMRSAPDTAPLPR